MTQTPTVGRHVHVLVDPSSNNGSDVAPAIITRVWSPSSINARVFHDIAGSSTIDGLTSIPLHADEETARAHLAQFIADQKEIHGHDHVPSIKHANHAYWPTVEREDTPAEPAPDEEPTHVTETADAVD